MFKTLKYWNIVNASGVSSSSFIPVQNKRFLKGFILPSWDLEFRHFSTRTQRTTVCQSSEKNFGRRKNYCPHFIKLASCI